MRGIATKSIRILKENGEVIYILDTPSEYLCGPWFGFYHDKKFHLFKNCDKDNPYKILNLKNSKSVSRLTIDFDKSMISDDPFPNSENIVKTRFYADVYFSKESLHCIFFYTVRNLTRKPLEDLRIYCLYDFDIRGLSFYNTDRAYYDSRYHSIVQHDESGVHAGFCSLNQYLVSHYSANHPFDLKVDENSPSLDDNILAGPDDLFIGMQWDLGKLGVDEYITIPIILAAGESREEFESNLQRGIERASRLYPAVQKLVRLPNRQSSINADKINRMSEVLKSKSSSREC
ncbi:MAG: hypothetical protein ACTSXU_08100 [Promethearchaeota archaeon]